MTGEILVPGPGPFGTTQLLDLAYTKVRQERADRLAAIFAESPDGVLMATNPLILPWPKYFGQGSIERFLEALKRFRDEVVLWATPIGKPEDKHFITALSKLYLSWLFGKDSEHINAFALPFGVTRYAGGVSMGVGAMGEGIDRVALAYSGAAEEEDRQFSRWVGQEFCALSENRLEALCELEEPKVNFITAATLGRLEPLPEAPPVASCLERLRALDDLVLAA